jgi:hypothetical protein
VRSPFAGLSDQALHHADFEPRIAHDVEMLVSRWLYAQGNRVNKQEARFLTEVSEIQATKGH